MSSQTSVLNRARTGFRKLSSFLAWLAGVGILVLVLPTVIDVTYRTLSGSSLPGMVEYSEIGIVFVVYLGVAKAMHDDVHISTPVVTSHLPARVAEVVRLIGRMLLWVLVAYGTWRTTLAAQEATAVREFRLVLVSVPTWPARIMVAVGFALLLVELSIEIAERIARLVSGDRAGAGEGNDGTPANDLAKGPRGWK